MTSNVRAVVDTNVTVSAALLPRSTPRRAFDRILEQGTSLISLATLAELNEVLRRPDSTVDSLVKTPRPPGAMGG